MTHSPALLTPAEAKTYREALGLTGEWIAARAGMSIRSVWFYENGRVPPTQKISDAILWAQGFVENQTRLLVATCNRSAQGVAPIVLIRYESDEDLWAHNPTMADEKIPVATHGVILYKTAETLRASGRTVIIHFARTADNPHDPCYQSIAAASAVIR